MPIQPFASPAVTYGSKSSPAPPSQLQTLRISLVTSQPLEQQQAAEELIKANDEQSILRIIYAARQGSTFAAEILRSNANMRIIPYLMEDVAHGSMQRVELNDSGFGNVRHAATQIVMRALLAEPGFPAATRAWFQYLASRPSMLYLPESSRFIRDWWVHNQETIAKGSLDKALWLPDVQTYSNNPWKESKVIPPQTPPPPPPPPPPSLVKLPFQLSETFEEWADRVIDPGQRDFFFVPLVSLPNGAEPSNLHSHNIFDEATQKDSQHTAITDEQFKFYFLLSLASFIAISAALVLLWQFRNRRR